MKKSFIILLVYITAVACNKQIDEIRPLTRIDKEGELASAAGIVETTVGTYSLLKENISAVYDEAVMNIGESRGGNVTLRKFGPPYKQTDAYFFQNSNGATYGYSADFFRGSYQVIISANATLEGIANFEKSSLASSPEADKNAVMYAKGENMFLRAFTYFNLIRVYGRPYYQNAESSSGVPLKTSSDIKDIPASSTVKEIFEFITKELQMAAQLMKAPVVKKNSFASTEAAWALLSRVYLYMGGSIASPDINFNKAAVVYADSAIDQNNGKYELLQGIAYRDMFADDEHGDLGRVTFADNKEIIFAFDNAAHGSSIGELFHLDQIYGYGGVFLPSPSFRQLLTPGDIRSSFFKQNTSSGLIETTKWLVLNDVTLARAPNIYFRLSEVYLNRAEAYAKLNNVTLAKADLKIIHTRAGLPASDVDNLSDADVITSVLQERRMELAFEGHASFDNFRNGLPLIRPAGDNNGNAATIQPDDGKVVFTIPNN